MGSISFIPAAPNSGTPVTIVAQWTGCLIEPGHVSQVETTYHIYFNYQAVCFATPPTGTQNFELGALHAGSYNVVEHFLVEGEPRVPDETPTASFVVADDPAAVPPAPTIGVTAVVVICILILVAARRFVPS